MTIQLNDKEVKALVKLLDAAVEYVEYEWSGDPWEEDARQMGEMSLDELNRRGHLDLCKKILKQKVERCKQN